MALNREQFEDSIRKLSIFNDTDNQHHCRVEICIGLDWRVLTDTCRLEQNIPLVHRALSDMLFIYVSENHPDAKVKDCVKLGEPKNNILTEGMKIW